MLQNPCKTLGFKKNMVYKIPPGGGGKPYPASGLLVAFFNHHINNNEKALELSRNSVCLCEHVLL